MTVGNEQAFREGWMLADVGTHMDIQRLDDPSSVPGLGVLEPKFANDQEAWEHVINQAIAGSAYHLLAIQLAGEKP